MFSSWYKFQLEKNTFADYCDLEITSSKWCLIDKKFFNKLSKAITKFKAYFGFYKEIQILL